MSLKSAMKRWVEAGVGHPTGGSAEARQAVVNFLGGLR